MLTRGKAVGMANATRGKAKTSAGKTNKRELLYVLAPRKTRTVVASSSVAKVLVDEPEATASTPVRSRKPSAKASSPRASSSKESFNATLVEPSIAKPKTTRATIAASSTRTARSRKSTPAITAAETSASASQELKRKRQSLDEDLSSFHEETKTFKKQKLSLEKEQKELKKLEAKLNSKSDKLEEREVLLQLRETDVEHSATARTSEQMLKLLEEGFNCSLCCDVIACPTTLTSYCGHEYCALCIIKWYFSKFHAECRSWHAPVECPLCRAPMRTPHHANHGRRNMDSCPFAPSRMADTALQLAVDALAEAPGGDKPSAKGKGKKKAVIDVDDPALEWRKGGSARRDWEERTRRGEAKRQELLQGWEGMLPPQFLAIKQQMDT